MRSWWCMSALALLLLSCGGRRQMSPEELGHKLDSIKAIEVKEKLELQGVHLEESDNLLKIFYDSLSMQTLPLSYTEDYVRFLPGFSEVQPEIARYMSLSATTHHMAACLPESLGARLILIAIEEAQSSHRYSLWLYSLDEDYFPVDKLCLYAIEDKSDNIRPEEFVQYFSITSDYEIHLLDYSKMRHKTQSEEIYYVDASRHFVLRETKLE
ncbi:MAG: hypothetical protein IJ618_10070 [Prevotella sp.]|nr:hypothetical protein [Prevotella sp.]